jgi:ABC-2 type transport system permease protein
MTFLGPLLFVGLTFGAMYLTMSDHNEYDVLISDPAGIISFRDQASGKIFSRYPERFKDGNQIRYFFTREVLEPDSFKTSPYNLLLELDDQTINDGNCNFFFKKLPGEMVTENIRAEVEESLERTRVTDKLALDYSLYKRAKLNVNLKEINIEKLGQEDKTQAKAMVGFAFAVLIYMFIFLYGVQVMRGVIEEKTNRIIEVIISSVKPFQLMMGKVIGIGMVGLTQFLMWVILSLVVGGFAFQFLQSDVTSGAAVIQNAQLAQQGVDTVDAADLSKNEIFSFILSINWPLMIGLFIFYFIGGYLLYGSIFAAIGAAVDNETDTQQFMLPVTIPLGLSYIVSAVLISNPESPVGLFFSIFPLTSPITMMVKVAIGAQWWFVLLSMLVLIAAFLFFIWMAGKIYRVGILMYGKKASFKELWKWLRYKY